MSRSITLLTVVVLACASCSEAQVDWANRTWQRVLDERAKALGYTGATMAVVRDGEVVFAGATGVADLETGRPLTPDDPMRLGSVSKMFTATLVQQLDQEGLLSVNDRVLTFEPDFPGDPATTLDHLGRHTSGLGDFRSDAEYERSPRRLEVHEMLALSYAQTQESPTAGRSFAYASANYLLLGLAIEHATGDSWEAALRTRIAERHQIGVHGGDGPPPIPGYDKARVDLTDHPHGPNSRASGGAISTAKDLALFADALVHGRILDEPHTQAMLSKTTLSTGRVEDHGFGVRVGDSRDGPYSGSRGHLPGYSCSWSHRPEVGATVAVLIPNAPHNGRALEHAAWEHLYQLEGRARPKTGR